MVFQWFSNLLRLLHSDRFRLYSIPAPLPYLFLPTMNTFVFPPSLPRPAVCHRNHRLAFDDFYAFASLVEAEGATDMFNVPLSEQAVNPVHEGLRKDKGIIICINYMHQYKFLYTSCHFPSCLEFCILHLLLPSSSSFPFAATPSQHLPPSFFARPAEVVASELIGCLLVKRQADKE